MPWMQEICSAQQCTKNTTLSNQQTHRRSSISHLLRKCGKLEVTVPSPPPPLLFKGGYYSKGKGGLLRLVGHKRRAKKDSARVPLVGYGNSNVLMSFFVFFLHCASPRYPRCSNVFGVQMSFPFGMGWVAGVPSRLMDIVMIVSSLHATALNNMMTQTL